MAKIKKEDPRFTRQLDLLEKYFNVDRQNKIIEMEFKYDKASDVLDSELSTLKKPLFKKEILETISEYLNMLPTGYKADVDIVLDDLEGYNPEDITDSLNDYLELNSYQIFREGKKKWLIASLLVFSGLILLVLKINLANLNLVSDYGKSIFEEVVDIIAWVFIWEAVTVLFLSPSDLLIYGIGLLKKVNVIKIGTIDNKHIQAKEDILDKWQYDSKSFKFARILWLTSSVFLMALATSSIISSLVFFTSNEVNLITALFVIPDVLIFLFGLSGILSYVGKNRLNVVMKVFGVILALLGIIIVIYAIYSSESQMIFTYSLITIFSLVLVLLPKRKIK